MWILDSEGDFLAGKRVWLRPGKRYLFGRTAQDGVRHAIAHTSISRKHLIIEVASVSPGDGSLLHTKSKLTITDQSKVGTIIDGASIKGSSKVLDGPEHTINLGRYQHPLRIKWQPSVLSFSFSSKELKAKDPLGPIRARLEDLDIKTVIPYIPEKTTHVVQNKRNTAKGLQALVNGKFIVQESYIDALVYAATPQDLENLESLSPLEEDFDATWPDPTKHLPPPGKEPVHRPAVAFAPNPSRSHIFEDYSFVFCDSSQFENLKAPINNGHGKALFYQVDEGKTTAEEIVQFMGNCVGNKTFHNGGEDGPKVVLVRFRAKGDAETWSIELGNQVALLMDQRVIEQSEFLDAILRNDPSPLCRALPRESVPASEPNIIQVAPSQIPVNVQQMHQSVEPEDTVETRLSKTSNPLLPRQFVSKVKTFDDGFDINSIPMYTFEPEDGSIDQSQNMEIEGLSQRSLPANQQAEHEDGMSRLLPGAQAMKRRRAEMGSPLQGTQLKPEAKEEARKPKRHKLDVLEAARQHREEEEAAARSREPEEGDRQQLTLDDMTIEEMQRLAVVEELELPLRDQMLKTAEQSAFRWDEQWNGRKNFKKFRRRGEPGVTRRHTQAVIVALEEVKQKDFGIGDRYWVGTREETPEPSMIRNSTQSREPSDMGKSQGSISHPSSRLPTPPPPTGRNKRQRDARASDSEDGELRFRFRRRR